MNSPDDNDVEWDSFDLFSPLITLPELGEGAHENHEASVVALGGRLRDCRAREG